MFRLVSKVPQLFIRTWLESSEKCNKNSIFKPYGFVVCVKFRFSRDFFRCVPIMLALSELLICEQPKLLKMVLLTNLFIGLISKMSCHAE
jgi:hypothetical protein